MPRPFATLLIPTFQRTPALPAGSKVELRSMVYAGSANVLDDPYRPRLKSHRHTATGLQWFYDGDAVDELAAYLRSNGVTETILDLEPAHAPENYAVCQRIFQRLRDHGLTTGWWGIDLSVPGYEKESDWVASQGPTLYPIWYPPPASHALNDWPAQKADRIHKLLLLRKRYPSHAIVPMLSHQRDAKVKPGEPAKVEYAGDLIFGGLVQLCRDYCEGVAQWPGASEADGNQWLEKFTGREPWWKVLAGKPGPDTVPGGLG